jgi:restriction system protein
MSKNSPSLLITFSYLPWWASVVAGVVVYLSLSYIFPSVGSDNQILRMLMDAGENVALWFALPFLIPAISSVFKRRKRKQLLGHQKSIETLRAASWSDFEVLVGEAFRPKGFKVQENMVGGADGGIDLILSKDGEQHLVQCKQWRTNKVGVSIVREMFGVLKASQAKTVYVITSGTFTKEATAFAQNLPIRLINGADLLNLIADVQTVAPQIQTVKNEMSSSCPKCTSPLVKRTAKRGMNKGNQFLGCSSFPKCRFIQRE